MIPADKIIHHLNLTPHPEGGYFRETYRSGESIPGRNMPRRYRGDRSFSTAIYFLLKGKQFSAFHVLQSDEIWHFYLGSPLTIYCIAPDGTRTDILLGNEINKGQKPQTVIEKRTWLAAAVNDTSSYSLIGCTMAPGFDFADFTLGDRKQLIDSFPQHGKIIRELTYENTQQ
jgi:uncharacterized protein